PRCQWAQAASAWFASACLGQWWAAAPAPTGSPVPVVAATICALYRSSVPLPARRHAVATSAGYHHVPERMSGHISTSIINTKLRGLERTLPAEPHDEPTPLWQGKLGQAHDQSWNTSSRLLAASTSSIHQSSAL